MKQIIILLLSITFLLSLDSFAQLRPAQSQYFQEKGALINPSFEQGYKGWSITGDCTQSLESDIPLLNKTLKLTCVNQSFTVKQNVDLSGFVDQQALLTSQVKASVDGMTVDSLANDVVQSTISVIAGDYKSVSIPIKVNSINNGVQYSATSVTGDFYIDNVSLRLAPDLVYDINNVDTDWIAYTPTFTGFGTVTGIDIEYKRVGDSLKVRGYFTSGTPTATEAQISLPDSLIIKGGSSTSISGSYGRSASTANAGGFILSTSGDSFVNMASPQVFSNTATISLNAVNGDNVAGSGERVSLEFEIPIQGWSTGRTQVVNQQTELTAATANEFSAIIESDGTVTTENYNWIDGNCTVTNTSNFDCNFVSGIFTQAPSCTVVNIRNATSAADAQAHIISQSTADVNYLTEAASSLIAYGASLKCSKQGNDVNKSQTIVGKFANINDTELSRIEASGNSAGSITANTTDIDWIEVNDEQGIFNGTAITPIRTGYYHISGAIRSTTAINPVIEGYIDGSIASPRIICGRPSQADTLIIFNCLAYIQSGQSFTFRSDSSFTLSNVNSHVLAVKETPDLSAIVENLSNNPRTARSDQYSETEIEWGLWNGQQLYRRCFTVASDITTQSTIVTWAAALIPKNAVNFVSDNWVLNGTTDGGTISRIVYDASTGNVRAALAGTAYKVGAGTSFCMNYVK